MSLLHIVGTIITIVLILLLSIFSGKSKNLKKRSNGAGIVAGVIMGTLVGGSSTVGTAQLAYNFGMSAWWFTLGGGIACLIQTILFSRRLRRENSPTIVGILRKEYGNNVGMVVSVLSSVGTFINIISQLLAASAVVLVIIPGLSVIWAVALSAVLMVLYVIFGGLRGAGMVGILKLILLYVTMAVCGIMVLGMAGGAGGFFATVKEMQSVSGVSFLSLFARGFSKDAGACISLILGVLTTQTYAQAYIEAKSDRAARVGGLISAFMIPPIGAFGILVGLYMRSVTDVSTFVAKTALTKFIIDYFPGVFGGIALGTLFIASIGTGAGLALGISTMLNNDIIKRFTKRFDDAKKSEKLSRLLIVAVLLIACFMSVGNLGDTILNFAFMSMGLRGAVIFVPMCFVLWATGKVKSVYAMIAAISGPVLVLIFGTVLSDVFPLDSLFIGVFVALIVMVIGFFQTRISSKKITVESGMSNK